MSTTPEGPQPHPSPGRIAVIGGAGFIGRSILQALVASDLSCSALVRRMPARPCPDVAYAQIDLTDQSSLMRALNGIDVIVHTASYTGSDEAECDAVNRVGTENVLRVARYRGIDRIINISTIGVYGPGPFRDLVEGEIDPRPVTALSRSRLAGDSLVHAHGGTTVRPGFVHGPGDRWFFPGFRQILDAAGTWIDNGDAVLSTIAVAELGQLVASLVRSYEPTDRGQLYHAAHPESVSVREVADALTGCRFQPPTRSCTFSEALERAKDFGLSDRQLDLIGNDHSISSARLWDRTKRTPAESPLKGLATGLKLQS